MVSNPPEVGVGLMYFPGLEAVLDAALEAELIDVVEIEAQPCGRFVEGKLRLRPELASYLGALAQSKLVHSVDAPVAGTVQAPESLIPVFDAVQAFEPPWASEHLNFNRVPYDNGSYFANFLMPAIQGDEVVKLAADNIGLLQSRLGVPIAIETPVNYLRPYPGELRDGHFYGAVADRADCGLLVDLHNLWCNERNGRQPVLDVIDDLPTDRVWEVHLAGGTQLDGYWLDAHSGLVDDALWELAIEVVTRLPNLKAIIFEVMPDYLAADGVEIAQIVAQLERMYEMWARRGTGFSSTRRRAVRPLAQEVNVPDAATWERALGAATRGIPATDELSHFLSLDPGLAIYRTMISSVRIGTIADLLPLTYRLLALTLGNQRTLELLERYIVGTYGHPSADQEVAQFRAWLATEAPAVANLQEVAEFEVASINVHTMGYAETVHFTREPLELLAALGAGHLPPAATGAGNYALEVQP